MEPTVFVGVPSRGQMAVGTATALLQMGRTRVYVVRTYCSSLLTLTFNRLWVAALNERARFTHFVMLHDDVVPLEAGWLDVLVREQRAARADVLSCVIPIKDERGLTSTAVWDRRANAMRRLTMHEAAALPPTFDAAAAGYPGWYVLPNTGLWICDFTRPWVERVCFTIRDKNFRGPSGEWQTQCFGEDWDFGVQCAELGVRVCATRSVAIVHKGGFDYPNMVGWGRLRTDDEVNHWERPAADRPLPQPHYEAA